MSSSLILAGLGMAAVGFGGRYVARTMPHMAKKAEEVTLTMLSRSSQQIFFPAGSQANATTFQFRGLG